MTTTLCASGAVVSKAGVNVNSSITDAEYTQWINQGESMIVIESGVDYVASFAGLTASKKAILEDACSSWAAIRAINKDPNAWSLPTAQTKLDFNDNTFERCMRLLKEKKNTDFLSKT